jgi:hypothetical protein
MPDGQERQWVVEPPAPGEVRLFVATGDGVDLTDEQQAAISALVETFEASDPEVMGLASCSRATCPSLICRLDCTLKSCDVLTKPAAATTGAFTLTASFGRPQ